MMSALATLSAPEMTTELSQPDELPFESDDDLRRRIVNFLHQRHVHALRLVEVDVNGGTVAIRGTVNSYHEKQLCLHCCQRVAGVIQIEDHIQVA